MMDEVTAGRACLCPPTLVGNLTIFYHLQLMVPFAETKGIKKKKNKKLTHESQMWKDAKTFP